MKWKLTGRYILSIIIVVVMVVVLNTLLLLSLLVTQHAWGASLLPIQDLSAEQFTREFVDEIQIEETAISLSEKGKAELEERHAWLQVLDDSGKVLYAYQTPPEAKTEYAPSEVVQLYKYKEIPDTTVFVGEKPDSGLLYSYFIGIQDPGLNRYLISYENKDILQFTKFGSFVLLLDVLAAVLVGYFFSKRLTQPLHRLIDVIKKLAHKDYAEHYQPQGLYKDVFSNVNYLTDQLTAAEQERKQLEKMREEWIANISHDIKTPLSSIRGYAELIKDPDYQFSPSEIQEYAAIIEDKALYIKDVMEDLNLSTRLKNKALVLNKKQVNVVSEVRKVVIDILNDSQFADRDISFHPAEENILLEMDEILFRRAVSNLVYNALVHNTEQVKVEVSIAKKEKIILTIQDNGKGISPAEQKRIFDRYYRGTKTAAAEKGSGLGMAIAKDIIEEHGGRLAVESEIGKGTRINIIF